MRSLAGRVVFLAVATAAVALLPLYVSEFRAYELARVGIFFIALLGLNLLTGYTGQISLGHGAFMAIGAYTTAILVTRYGIRDLWTIPLAGLVTGAVGFLFGFPALRLAGVYLALATFALAVAVPSLAKYGRIDELTGGGSGLLLDLPATPFGLPFSPSDWLYYLCWGIGGVLFVTAWVLVRGRTGRAFRAIRENELAAVSSGVGLASYKTLAFGVSAFYGGVAGSLYGITINFVNPDTFPVSLSILLLTGVVVGGLGSLAGVVFGAVFIQYVPLYAGDMLNWPLGKIGRTLDPATTGVPAVVYGLILLGVLLAAPAGAAGLLRRIRGALTSRALRRIVDAGGRVTSSRRQA
ncbi:MAG: branched-chain amino acid ABC transporter permease [Gaiellaceae bacterium]